MTVRVGKAHFHDWVSLELPGGWSDTFILRMSPLDGLPPADYAWTVRPMALQLLKLRKPASLWVQVEAEGRWYIQEVRHALRGLGLPVAVTKGSSKPQGWEFSFTPWVERQPISPPPSCEPYLAKSELSFPNLSCLRVLARADCAYTAEVASLAGLRLPTARKALHELGERKLVGLRAAGKNPYWKIGRLGLSVALRSWGLAPGVSFPRRKERGLPACKEREKYAGENKATTAPKKRRASAGRHRRTARLWPAWLRRAWPRAEVWAGWTEVACGRTRPDALCWGRLEGDEALFWLEVEVGNASGEVLRSKILRRVNYAILYARRIPVRLVFTLLGPPWVRQEIVRIFRNLPEDVAVVLEDWKAFGELPISELGRAGWR
ncbi:MAG: hypothetical protein PVF74_01060 [Anaerolineales bacterium]|jgi:hypothetical protein